MTAPSSSTLIRRLGAVMIAAAGVLHVILVPEYLAEAPALGVAFLLAGPLTLWPAYRLWRRDDPPAWLLGALVTAGMIVGFLLSRTVGLFGYSSTDWAEGIPSLLVEVVFLAFAARYAVLARIWARQRA